MNVRHKITTVMNMLSVKIQMVIFCVTVQLVLKEMELIVEVL